MQIRIVESDSEMSNYLHAWSQKWLNHAVFGTMHASRSLARAATGFFHTCKHGNFFADHACMDLPCLVSLNSGAAALNPPWPARTLQKDPYPIYVKIM
jgi:hypothetical protein